MMAASAAILTAGALAPAVSAQESQAGVCVVSIGRGATVPGGATGTMTVRNVGWACRIVNFISPEQRVATSRLPGREGQILPFTVRIQVRVIGPDTPVR